MPPARLIKVNCDASVCKENKIAGCGGVIKDQVGNFIGECSITLAKFGLSSMRLISYLMGALLPTLAFHWLLKFKITT
ncbi:hypothetical protein CR513_25791, partial [Mucuna pruriens]